MNLVVTISGRDALPVRALCFVAGRKRLSPDVVAGAACAEGHYSGEGALPTYKLVDGVVQAVDPTHWVLFYEAIESASLLLRGKGPSLRATRTQWFNESTMLLPGGVFVWLDEFQDWFRRTRPYRVNEGETGSQLELPEEGRVSLMPPIPDGLKGCLLAGFPSAPELPTTPTPEQPARADDGPVTAGAPLSRQRHQENEMLRVLADLGYNPKRLPRPPAGAAGPKSEARAKLPEMSSKVFDKAWERLRSAGDIADAE